MVARFDGGYDDTKYKMRRSCIIDEDLDDNDADTVEIKLYGIIGYSMDDNSINWNNFNGIGNGSYRMNKIRVNLNNFIGIVR